MFSTTETINFGSIPIKVNPILHERRVFLPLLVFSFFCDKFFKNKNFYFKFTWILNQFLS